MKGGDHHVPGRACRDSAFLVSKFTWRWALMLQRGLPSLVGGFVSLLIAI